MMLVGIIILDKMFFDNNDNSVLKMIIPFLKNLTFPKNVSTKQTVV